MSDTHDKQLATVKAKGSEAWLVGLTRDDNPYTVTSKQGRKWARVWLQGFSQAEHGLTCDTCDKWLSKQRGYKFEYHNGFIYWLCATCNFVTTPKESSVK